MTQQKNLAQLFSVLDTVYQSEQFKMAKVMARVAELRSQLAALERPATPSPSQIEPAVRAGADLLWQQWAEDRKILINQELAAAYQEGENIKAALIAALSKREAAKKLNQRAAAEASKTQERRSSW